MSHLHKSQFQVYGRSKCERLNDKASRRQENKYIHDFGVGQNFLNKTQKRGKHW